MSTCKYVTANMCLEIDANLIKGEEDIGISHLIKAFYGSPSQNVYKFPNSIIWKYMKHIYEVGPKTNYKIDLQYFKSLLYDISINNLSTPMKDTVFQHIRVGDVMQFVGIKKGDSDVNGCNLEKCLVELNRWFNDKNHNLRDDGRFEHYISSKKHYSSIIRELPKNIKCVVLLYSSDAFQIKKNTNDETISEWLALSQKYIEMIAKYYRHSGYKVVHIQQEHTRDDILSLASKMEHFSLCGGGFGNLLANLCLMNNGRVYPHDQAAGAIRDFDRNMIDPHLSHRLKLYECSKEYECGCEGGCSCCDHNN